MAVIILNKVRLSFPAIFAPDQPPAGSTSGPKYGAHGIMAPGSEAAQLAHNTVLQVAREKWGENFQNVLQSLPRDKVCLRPGNQHLDKSGSIRNGYKDMLYIVARNKSKPAVIDKHFVNGQPVYLDESAGRPYGGCYVNLKVDIYALDKPGQGKSINATLLAVQFAGDGEAFAGAPGTPEGFEDMSGGDDAGNNAFGSFQQPAAQQAPAFNPGATTAAPAGAVNTAAPAAQTNVGGLFG